MASLFPSEEWILELMEVVNQSSDYAKAAEKWEGDLNFIVEPGPGLPKPACLYMDLWHGSCRSAGLFPIGEKNAEFEISAPLATWRQVIDGKLDPIMGLTTRRLKLKLVRIACSRMPVTSTSAGDRKIEGSLNVPLTRYSLKP